MGNGTLGERVSILEEKMEQFRTDKEKLYESLDIIVRDHSALKTHLKMIFAALAATSIFGEPGKAILKILGGM